MKNTIFKDSWHAKLYLRAYVEDRTWLDPSHADEFASEAYAAGLPEQDAVDAFTKANPTVWRGEGEAGAELDRLYHAAALARDAWCERKFATYSAEKSAEIRQKFFSGKTSLCPYFWSVVYAIVAYYGVVLISRRVAGLMKQFIDQITPVFDAIEHIAATTWKPALLGTAIAGALTLGLAIQVDILDSPADLLASYRQEQADETRKALERQQWERHAPSPEVIAEYELLKKRHEWEQFVSRPHPREIQEAAAYRAQSDYQYFLVEQERDRERAEYDARIFWGNVGEFAMASLFLVGMGVLAIVLSVCLSFFWAWLKGLRAQAKETSVWATIVDRKRSLINFIHDTIEFVVEFYKTYKKQVCPYLEVVDRDTHV